MTLRTSYQRDNEEDASSLIDIRPMIGELSRVRGKRPGI